MKKRKLKILLSVIIAVILVIFSNKVVNANYYTKYSNEEVKYITSVADTTGDSSGKSSGGIFKGADDFIKNGAGQAGTRGESDAASAVNEVGAMMVNIAGYILVAGVIFVGIKYMMANPEGKAKLKGQLIGLAVATFVVFGAKWIWETIISIFNAK